jgi:hypothetical protein
MLAIVIGVIGVIILILVELSYWHSKQADKKEIDEALDRLNATLDKLNKK